MMAIFPRKYQRPRYSGMSGCPPLPPPALLPPALLLLQACCRGYAAGAMPQGLCCTCSNCCTGHMYCISYLMFRNHTLRTIWTRFTAFCINLDPFYRILHQFGPVLPRSASIWTRFTMFCINLDPFCRVLHQFGPVLRRSASIWNRFAAFCINLGPFCRVLHQFGPVLQRSASIWTRFAAFCINLVPFCDLVPFCFVLP